MLQMILAIENEQDRSFVEWVYETYEKKMYIEAIEILKDHHDAQDCIHETVRKIIDALPTFQEARDKGLLGGLVAVSCRNCALNMYKKRERRRKLETVAINLEKEHALEDEGGLNEGVDIQKIVISEENCRYIQTLIQSLDAKYRDVILLKSKGLEYAQIAALLDITEETARQRMVRGRKLLLQKGGRSLYELSL